jgi:SAM-dependent methyltransferase
MPTTWADGDYPRMAQRLGGAAELAVERAAVVAGERVLDVACGTGNAALVAAAHGARVDGIDIEPTLLSVASERARAAGVAVHWHRGEAERLDVDDGEFDVVLSVFGAMYASDHDAAAGELARACDPAGRIVLAAWTPGSFMPALGGVFAPYLPAPPAGAQPPSRWGDETTLGELLGAAGLVVAQSERHMLSLHFDGRHAAAEFLVATAGHVISERRRLQGDGRWTDLLADVSVFVAEQDRGSGAAGATLELEYLLAVARHADS